MEVHYVAGLCAASQAILRIMLMPWHCCDRPVTRQFSGVALWCRLGLLACAAGGPSFNFGQLGSGSSRRGYGQLVMSCLLGKLC
jgi:hypothetical protein